MLLGLVPLIPFLGFMALLIFGTELQRRTVSIIGVGSIALSALVALVCAFQFDGPFQTNGWTWISFVYSSPSSSPIQFGFYLDSLSLLMICLVTFVATWIALFSVQFMEEEDDLTRFFASMNLFVASMLILVLADNLLLLLLGWEGVGLCSYLLIGFWYKNVEAGRAATKAFIMTRIGDIGLLIATLIIFVTFEDLDIQNFLEAAKETWHGNPTIATMAALCILFAATGKSAQLPLQTWLPDAMLGPTPVSALIHAATMVTAGVYLIARLSGLFELSSIAQMCVLVIGAATLLIAGISALAQNDLKRVLAYSTMSQIGYMFLALGAGAYSAAMFHLLTHAFFKALLFLSAGVIGYAAHHEYNMFRLGGLKKTLPLAYYSFLVGALCLSALPLVTSGFYSKEFILSGVLNSVDGGLFAWICGIVGAFVTGLYTFRAISLTFFGEAKTGIHLKPGLLMAVPLVVLAIFSIGLGFLQTPSVLFDIHMISDWLASVFPHVATHDVSVSEEWISLLIASAVSLLGISGGLYLFRKSRGVDNVVTKGLGFDDLYQLTLVLPFQLLSSILRRDIFGRFFQGVARLVYSIANYLGHVQSGRISDYAGFIAFSIIVIVGFVVFR